MRRPSQAGLLTREERFQLRLLASDLERRLERTNDPAARLGIQRGLASVKREQQADRASRPRGTKNKAGKKGKRR